MFSVVGLVMDTKPIKIKGDPYLISIIVPCLMERIERGDGTKCGDAFNHHAVIITIMTPDGEKDYICYAYETKAMIHLQYGVNHG